MSDESEIDDSDADSLSSCKGAHIDDLVAQCELHVDESEALAAAQLIPLANIPAAVAPPTGSGTANETNTNIMTEDSRKTYAGTLRKYWKDEKWSISKPMPRFNKDKKYDALLKALGLVGVNRKKASAEWRQFRKDNGHVFRPTYHREKNQIKSLLNTHGWLLSELVLLTGLWTASRQ